MSSSAQEKIADEVHPIGAYDAYWLRPHSNGYIVYISLVERSQQQGRVLRKNHLLRVGAIFEGIFEDTEALKTYYANDELCVCDLVLNDIGRLLTPLKKEWVALDSADPHEHYMAQHLQNVLTHLAKRVVASNRELNLRLFDQRCLIERDVLSVPSSMYNVPAPVSSVRVVMREIRNFEANETSLIYPIYSEMNRNNVGPVPELCFENTVITVACRVPAGLPHLNRFIACQARLAVAYYNHVVLPYPLPAEASHGPLRPRGPSASHLVVRLFPYYSDLPVRPKELVFDVASLPHLGLHFDVDEKIGEGAISVSRMLRQLVDLCRFENSSSGVTVMVNGAFNQDANSEYCRWNEGDSDEGESSLRRLHKAKVVRSVPKENFDLRVSDLDGDGGGEEAAPPAADDCAHLRLESADISGVSCEVWAEFYPYSRFERASTYKKQVCEVQMKVHAMELQSERLRTFLVLGYDTLVELVQYSVIPVMYSDDEEEQGLEHSRAEAVALLKHVTVDTELQSGIFRAVVAGLSLTADWDAAVLSLQLLSTRILLC